MKKLALIATAAFLSAAAVSAFVYANNGKNSMGELFNANVEALSAGEEAPFNCYNTITNSWQQMVFYCGTCSFIQGKPVIFSGKGRC